MQTAKASTTKLILKDSNWVLKFVAVFIIVLGGGFFLSVALPYHISCQLKEPGLAKACVVSQSFTGYFSARRIKDLKALKLYSGRSQKDKVYYKIRLKSENKSYILPMIRSFNASLVKEAVKAGNAYILGSSEGHVQLPSFYPWYLKLFLLIFPLAGIAALLYASNIKVIFDKTANTLTIQQKNWFREQVKPYPLDQIKSIYMQSDQGNDGTRTYRLVCEFNNRDLVPLNPVFDNRYRSKKKALDKMKAFGLPVLIQ